MHPDLFKFIEQFEREAVEKGLYRSKVGEAELTFLNEVWGPAFHYNFEGLKVEYPLKDFKGGQRFADFVFIKNGAKILFEIDGFTTHARNISPGEFDDHLRRQNDLILSGWLVLRFSANQVQKQPQVCQRQLKQAFGQEQGIFVPAPYTKRVMCYVLAHFTDYEDH
jgi:very-short-patch-repair endonuclease